MCGRQKRGLLRQAKVLPLPAVQEESHQIMFKTASLFLAAALAFSPAMAQLDPSVTSWKLNTNAATGYNNIPSDIQQVQYSDTNVYISATCIPGYDIGPWNNLPATQVPVNENFVYKITRNPQPNPGTPVVIGGGHVGVWSNGVSIFNAQDAYSYNNQNTWHRDAVYFEGNTFDSCLGHPAPNGEYHTHLNPRCLYDDADSTHHSPIIGYAFDGYPVYGAYAYSDTNGTGPIKRMASSYRLRSSMTTRDTLPDGTVVTGPQAGPAVNVTYPLGYFLEDYEYVPGLGDLDEHNGRWCKTPEYPNGTYCYFMTIDAALTAVFPYVIYSTYYGLVQPGNTGPSGGHNTITETVTTYDPTAVQQLSQKSIVTKVYPNPAGNYIFLYIQPVNSNNFTVTLTDEAGRLVYIKENIQPTITYSLDLGHVAAGMYHLNISNTELRHSEKILIRK